MTQDQLESKAGSVKVVIGRDEGACVVRHATISYAPRLPEMNLAGKKVNVRSVIPELKMRSLPSTDPRRANMDNAEDPPEDE